MPELNLDSLLRVELAPVGFSFLDMWEVACPLVDYDVLAAQVDVATSAGTNDWRGSRSEKPFRTA